MNEYEQITIVCALQTRTVRAMNAFRAKVYKAVKENPGLRAGEISILDQMICGYDTHDWKIENGQYKWYELTEPRPYYYTCQRVSSALRALVKAGLVERRICGTEIIEVGPGKQKEVNIVRFYVK